MLQYKLKRFYRNFADLKEDILKLYPNAKIQDDYFNEISEDSPSSTSFSS